jgi:hypothetical protein
MEIILFLACAAIVLGAFFVYGRMTQNADRSGLRGIVRAWGLPTDYLQNDQRTDCDRS